MAKITRKTQKIFADSAPTNQLTTFGTAKDVTPNNSRDLDDIQNANYLSGWASAVEADKAPYEEDTNGLFYLVTKQLAYLFQQGISEWDSATAYYQKSIVIGSDANIYRCLTDNCVNVDPTTDDGTNWFVYPLTAANQDLSNLSATGELKFTNKQTIGDWCNTEPTAISTATNNKPVVVVANYRSGADWCRVYSDGWCEQGGSCWGTQQPKNTSVSLNSGIHKPYKDTNYSITLTFNTPVSGDQAYNHMVGASNKTTSGFDVQGYKASSTRVENSYDWETRGYI